MADTFVSEVMVVQMITTTKTRTKPHARRATLFAAVAAALLVTGCTTGPGPSEASPSTQLAPATGPTPELTVDITIAGGQVTPSGKKIDTTVGTTVVFKVTSDMDDEIHAHTGGDGYELAVEAGKPATGSVTLTSPGSFEVESHHLEKVIVILNAR